RRWVGSGAAACDHCREVRVGRRRDRPGRQADEGRRAVTVRVRERVAALAAVLDHELEALVGTRGRTVDAVRTGRVAVRQIAETDVRELGAVAVGPVRLHQQLRAPADPVLNEDPLARADLPGLVWTE